MKKNSIYTLIIGAVLLFASCSLIEPNEIDNPNISEKTFIEGSNAMDTWVNGAEKTLSKTVGTFCLHTEIISDNYFNNYTRESKLFDKPELNNNDPDVESMERGVATLREAANLALDKIKEHDKTATQEHLFKLTYIKAYAYLLGGENFMALPVTEGGEPKKREDLLQLAIQTLNEAEPLTNNNIQKAFIHTLKARAYYRLGKADRAIDESKKALLLKNDLLVCVEFDGANNVNNAIQDDIWKTMYQPLPRLDFLDPKYYQLKATDQCPISIAKAEENYLIIAEALLSKNQMAESKNTLKDLLTLVKKRPIEKDVKDWNDNRFNGGFKHYPDSAIYKVAAAPGEVYREGLVLNRKKPQLINIYTVSGTSVTTEMIDKCNDADGLLELIYLLRQEIFIAEGRRINDLGIRLPINEVEVNHTPSAKQYEKALIPQFIPLGQEMDAFDIDTNQHLVTIHHNMNKVIVKNKKSPYVVPFL